MQNLSIYSFDFVVVLLTLPYPAARIALVIREKNGFSRSHNNLCDFI